MKKSFLDTQTVADLPEELAKFNELGDFTGYENTSPDQVVDHMLASIRRRIEAG